LAQIENISNVNMAEGTRPSSLKLHLRYIDHV